MSAIFKMAAKTRHKIWAEKIQQFPISSKFDMWVDSVSGRFGRIHNRQIIIISCYYYYSISPFFLLHVKLSTAHLRKYWTEFHETWWSYRYMFLVGPKVFSFVVKGVKIIFLWLQRGWWLLQNPMGKLKFRILMLITSKWIMIET